jgi:hypothetical protein
MTIRVFPNKLPRFSVHSLVQGVHQVANEQQGESAAEEGGCQHVLGDCQKQVLIGNEQQGACILRGWMENTGCEPLRSS